MPKRNAKHSQAESLSEAALSTAWGEQAPN